MRATVGLPVSPVQWSQRDDRPYKYQLRAVNSAGAWVVLDIEHVAGEGQCSAPEP